METNNKNFRPSRHYQTIQDILQMQTQVKQAAKMAFEAVDTDKSDLLEKPELARILKQVAKA